MTGKVTAARIRLDRVVFHPMNTRRDLGDLRDLTASIKRFGVLQPVTVEQHGDQLRLRAGHRRTAAARLAGLGTVPALVHARALDDDEFVMQALHENVVRRGLDHDERRTAIRRLLDLGCTPEGIARDLGVHEKTVRRWSQDGARTTGERAHERGRRRIPASRLEGLLQRWDAQPLSGDARRLLNELQGLLLPAEDAHEAEITEHVPMTG